MWAVAPKGKKKTTGRSPMNGGDYNVPSSPLSTYYCIPLRSLLAHSNKPKTSVASEVYHVVIATANRVNRMAKRLEGNFGRFARRRSFKSREKLWRW
jgi:hypothetical protein